MITHRRRLARFLEKAAEVQAVGLHEPWLELRRALAWCPVGEVMAVVKAADNPEQQERLLWAIGYSGMPTYTRPFVRYLWNEGRRSLAIQAAGDARDPWFVPLMLTALDDPDAFVRRMAAQNLTWPFVARRARRVRRRLLSIALDPTGESEFRRVVLQSLLTYPRPPTEDVPTLAQLEIAGQDPAHAHTVSVLVSAWRLEPDAPRSGRRRR